MFKIIAVPAWFGGAHKDGVEAGPKKILESFNLSADAEWIAVPQGNPTNAGGKVKYLSECLEVSKKTKESVKRAAKSGKVPAVITGDDSYTFGILAGLAEVHKDFVAFWFDSHGDINTPKSSPSGTVHGMPLAIALGYGDKRLVAVSKKKKSITNDKLVLVGTRDLDAPETLFIRKQGILKFSSDEISVGGVDRFFETIGKDPKISKVKKAFIHFDVDVLDPKESPSAAMPVPEGLSVEESTKLLTGLLRRYELIGFSVSEYNPTKDDGRTLNAIREILGSFGLLKR
ncbi:MAG: arginase family protein [archaeon]